MADPTTKQIAEVTISYRGRRARTLVMIPPDMDWSEAEQIRPLIEGASAAFASLGDPTIANRGDYPLAVCKFRYDAAQQAGVR